MRYFWSFALAALFAGAASAQSLEAALDRTWRTNPTIQAERSRQKATRELKPQAIAAALPQIQGGGAASKIDATQTFNADALGGSGEPQNFGLNTLSGQVEGSLRIFDGFRNLNAIRAAGQRIEAGGAQLSGVEQEVLLDAAGAYFDVLRDRRIYDANVNNVEVLLRQREEAALRFKVGEVTRTDVAQAEARLSRAKADVNVARAQLAFSRAEYTRLIGEPPVDLEEDPALPDLPESLAAAQALGRQFAPQIVAARAREAASKRDINVARAAFAPQIDLTASYQYADEPSAFTVQDEQFAYGLRASMPIFLGGLNLSRVREAKALNEADRRRILEADRAVQAQIVSAWEQLLAARATVESARAELAANELALEGVRREAQLGARTTLDVLNAEQETLNAAVTLARAERETRFATFSLLAAAGVLTAPADSDDDAS